MNASQKLKTQFFSSYSGVKLPLKLVGSLSDQDMDNRNTYFEGQFDTENRLVICKKMVYGDIELQHEYQYYPNSHNLKQAAILDIDGEQTLLNFDEMGNQTK